MGGKTDIAKGRIKEAAGVLSDNDKLRDEGRKDQAVGRVKNVAARSVEVARESSRKMVDSAKVLAQKTIDRAKGKH